MGDGTDDEDEVDFFEWRDKAESHAVVSASHPETIKKLSQDPRMRHVDRVTSHRSAIRPRDLAPLQNFGSIEVIEFTLNKIEPEDVAVLARFRGLRSLIILSQRDALFGEFPKVPRYSAEVVRALGKLPLEALRLEGTFPRETFLAFGDNPTLNRLVICGPGVDDTALRGFVPPKNLKTVVLTGRNISPEAIEVLARCEHLGSVLLSFGEWKGEPWEALARLPNVDFLSISGGSLSGVGIGALAKAKRLRSLMVEVDGFSREACEELPQLAQLESLRVLDAFPTHDVVKKLVALPNLSTLFFGVNVLSPESQQLIDRELENRPKKEP